MEISTSSDYFVHPNALVEKGAKIGPHSRIWAFTHVLGGAEIGSHCNICDFSFIESGAKLGNHVTVKSGVYVWEGVTAEDGVFLGPACVLTNDKLPRSFIKRPKAEWLKPILLKEGCTLGANCTVVCGVTVGRFAFIGAGAVVTKDVPDHALMVGNPARQVGWVCRCGIKIENSKELCADCRQEKHQL